MKKNRLSKSQASFLTLFTLPIVSFYVTIVSQYIINFGFGNIMNLVHTQLAVVIGALVFLFLLFTRKNKKASMFLLAIYYIYNLVMFIQVVMSGIYTFAEYGISLGILVVVSLLLLIGLLRKKQSSFVLGVIVALAYFAYSTYGSYVLTQYYLYLGGSFLTFLSTYSAVYLDVFLALILLILFGAKNKTVDANGDPVNEKGLPEEKGYRQPMPGFQAPPMQSDSNRSWSSGQAYGAPPTQAPQPYYNQPPYGQNPYGQPQYPNNGYGAPQPYYNQPAPQYPQGQPNVLAPKSGAATSNSQFMGTSLGLFWLYLWTYIVTILTVFIATPFMICKREEWVASRTVIDGRQLVFDGNGGQLFGKFLVWLLLTVITVGIFLLFLPMQYKKWIVSHTHLR